MLDPGRSSIGNSLSVFIYHEVSDTPSPFMNTPNLNVPPALFARQMDFIRKHFNVISPDMLLEGNFKRPAALVTFDDGMLGYFQNAVPIMTEKKIPSINFLNMETIEGGLSWTGLVSYLAAHDPAFTENVARRAPSNHPLNVTLIDPADARDYLASANIQDLHEKVTSYTGAIAAQRDLEAVADNPFVFFGNHLFNHYSALVLDKKTFTEQYSVNQEKIDRYPNGRAMFAYPFGRYIHRQNDLLKSLGAEAVFYSSEGINREHSNRLYNRMSVDTHMTRIEDLLGQVRWLSFRHQRGWDYRGHEDTPFFN